MKRRMETTTRKGIRGKREVQRTLANNLDEHTAFHNKKLSSSLFTFRSSASGSSNTEMGARKIMAFVFPFHGGQVNFSGKKKEEGERIWWGEGRTVHVHEIRIPRRSLFKPPHRSPTNHHPSISNSFPHPHTHHRQRKWKDRTEEVE